MESNKPDSQCEFKPPPQVSQERICLGLSIAVFVITVVGGALSWGEVIRMRGKGGGGFSGYAAMGQGLLTIYMSLVGFLCSLSLALVASLKLRAGVFVLMLETILVLLFGWLIYS
jgi:hypothetical protein